MSGKRPTSARLSQPAQIRALGQPIRLEIVQAFRPGESLSVEELAKRVGRRPVPLYYHVRNLVTHGILVTAGRRQRTGPPQSLYRPVADRLLVGPEERSPAGRRAAIDVVRATLRATERDFTRALASPPVTGPARPSVPLVGQRSKGRLNPAELASVERHLKAVERIFLKARSRKLGLLVALTTVMVSVDPDLPGRRDVLSRKSD